MKCICYYGPNKTLEDFFYKRVVDSTEYEDYKSKLFIDVSEIMTNYCYTSEQVEVILSKHPQQKESKGYQGLAETLLAISEYPQDIKELHILYPESYLDLETQRLYTKIIEEVFDTIKADKPNVFLYTNSPSISNRNYKDMVEVTEASLVDKEAFIETKLISNPLNLY